MVVSGDGMTHYPYILFNQYRNGSIDLVAFQTLFRTPRDPAKPTRGASELLVVYRQSVETR